MKKHKHIQHNFRDMVVAASLNAHKDFINKQIIAAASHIADTLSKQISQVDIVYDVVTDILIEFNQTLTTLTEALAISDKPKITPLTKDDIKERIYVCEDKRLKMERCEEPAQKGWRVIFNLTDIAKKEIKQLTVINSLASFPAELNATLENGIIGMKPGECKLISVDLPDGDKTTTFTYEVELLRVSKPINETKDSNS